MNRTKDCSKGQISLGHLSFLKNSHKHDTGLLVIDNDK